MVATNYIDQHFESKKNWHATIYTLVICGLLIFFFLIASWTLPGTPPVMQEEGIEVNLGNSDRGLGTNQPFLPGKPSPRDEEKYTPPKQAVVEKAATKDFETNDKDEEAPALKKPRVVKPEATKIPDKEIVKKVPPKVIKPEITPEPVKPKPKAVFHGVAGTGTGGNDADQFKQGGNQGIAGGKGDQGKPGGNPNSTNYEGNGGTGNSISIRGLEGRHITSQPSFTDDFSENAKVAIDVHVDAAGNVTSTDYQLRGSTTSEASMVAIAKRKAKQVKFNTGNGESLGTLIFNFKIKN
jgi:outer membrane biosynthesis protein TonB